ncbi:hypothetical protein BJ912DRAFT_587449 [Pholiota molesta]|nr:hypothetical protein BJ912DRAFT_587449 [Pholiota molesta]
MGRSSPIHLSLCYLFQFFARSLITTSFLNIKYIQIFIPNPDTPVCFLLICLYHLFSTQQFWIEVSPNLHTLILNLT